MGNMHAHKSLTKLQLFSIFLISMATVSASAAKAPTVQDKSCGVTYHGLAQSGVEKFFGIWFGQDTGGSNRFKPPEAYTPPSGSSIDATSRGPACPQPHKAPAIPFYWSNYTHVSEDCLSLNIYRPKGTASDAKLPVLIYIHGGSFFEGSKDELVSQPEGLVLQSVKNDDPIIAVTINYRLGAFGFAQSEALLDEGSTNAGLRDQRLGIEWVRDHIGPFGGDGERITISGQSSGGLAVGLQIMAYGGTKPLPFQQAICESQALEPGITGNFTLNAMQKLARATGCNASDLQAVETIDCLRALSMHDLLRAQINTHGDGPAENVGDEWLPVVDGDFLPKPPSRLITERGFHSVPSIIGWTDADTVPFVGNPQNNADVLDFFTGYLPGFTTANIHRLLSLYPPSEFHADKANDLPASLFRAGRILRDILMTCQPIHYARAISEAGSPVYLYDWNQTMLDPFLPGYGPVHTSEFAYVFGNLSHYDGLGYPYHPDASDRNLRARGAGSWASFVSRGEPSAKGRKTLKGWTPAFARDGEGDVFVAGGPHQGLWAEDGARSTPALEAQRLRERCAFINSPDIIEQLLY